PPRPSAALRPLHLPWDQLSVQVRRPPSLFNLYKLRDKEKVTVKSVGWFWPASFAMFAGMASESRTAVIAAIIGNLAIATTKFIAAAFTGSSAMLSEGIHSLVDTGNGGVLLFGVRLSRKPADATHPFGYGKEIYFWSLIVAILIFALGGGMSIYEGVNHLRHPVHMQKAV